MVHPEKCIKVAFTRCCKASKWQMVNLKIIWELPSLKVAERFKICMSSVPQLALRFRCEEGVAGGNERWKPVYPDWCKIINPTLNHHVSRYQSSNLITGAQTGKVMHRSRLGVQLIITTSWSRFESCLEASFVNEHRQCNQNIHDVAWWQCK